MKERGSRITDVLALVTLTVFSLAVLLVLLTGADLYRDLVDRGQQTYDRRTALQYLTTRVRQAERADIGTLEGNQALILEETVEGEIYTTYVYCYEGWLRELYVVPGADLPPRAGAPLLEGKTFGLQKEESLLTVTLDGEALLLHLPTGKAVDP